MSYFPMFVQLEGKDCLVVGGGKVALRKVNTLQDFGAIVTVIAPSIVDEIKNLPDVIYAEREYEVGDLDGQTLVVAATGDHDQNHEISVACKERMIPINAVDQVEDCTFIFPAYQKAGEVVGAFTSGGKSPVLAQYLKEQAEDYVNPAIGRLADYLGSIRDEVKAKVPTEEKRRRVYADVMTFVLIKERYPFREELDVMIQNHLEDME